MKKISRIICDFFKSIWLFFDKWLIMPITKFFVSIYDFFGSSGNGLEKILINRQSLVVISLIFDLFTFYVIDQKHVTLIDNSAEVLYNQKVTANYNEALYVVEGIPETVDVTLVGRRWDVYLAKQYPIDGVTLDLTGYTPGSYAVSFKYEQAVSSVEYKIDPSTVNIRIYDKISVTKELSYDIIHKDNLDTKLDIDSVVLDRDSVIVKGATHQLEEVAIVKAIIDVDKISNVKVGSTTLSDVPLIPYDSEGNKLDVEIVPSKIEVEVDLSSPSKTVPIRAIPKGDVTFGQAISSINLSQNNVTVYGKQSVLDDLEYVPLEVDVDGLKENREYKLDLKKPKGVRSMSVNNVTVEVSLGTSADKDIPNVNIDVRNLDDRYSVQGLSQNDIQVTVSLKGVESVLNNLEADDVTAYIDLKGYEPGEYEVDVHVSGTDSRVQYLSKTKKVKIRVVEK